MTKVQPISLLDLLKLQARICLNRNYHITKVIYSSQHRFTPKEVSRMNKSLGFNFIEKGSCMVLDGDKSSSGHITLCLSNIVRLTWNFFENDTGEIQISEA